MREKKWNRKGKRSTEGRGGEGRKSAVMCWEVGWRQEEKAAKRACVSSAFKRKCTIVNFDAVQSLLSLSYQQNFLNWHKITTTNTETYKLPGKMLGLKLSDKIIS